ncbi:hypothetical protein [Acinetobacter lanii]|uniref:Lipoprotein n=1 Tax=Acinetobacter lanii TaxID=2715163 RepID=A0A6G8S0A1_9GAMM|nr:hypothetical protein [Acinetobacter lanii]QIO07619.1 hypothetical protein G8D99_00320 [Acinetobacter lanii]
MKCNFKCQDAVFLPIICVLSFALGACDSKPQNALAQQQHFICKSLIEGFLKAEHLGQYELEQIQPMIKNVVSTRNYIYRVSAENQIRFNSPQQKNLHFQCQHSKDQNYTVQLVNRENKTRHNLMYLQVPPKQVIQQLSAYAMKNST